MKESDKVVSLVTGGAGGLGSALARRLVSIGHHVVISYLNSRKEAESLAEGLKGRCMAFKCDISSAADVERMAEELLDVHGRLDNLINNAAVVDEGLLVRYPEDAWDRVVDINLKGCFNCIKTFAPIIKSSGGGHIINIASRAGLVGSVGQAAYSASKAGMIGLGLTAAAELGTLNIRVNTVTPGYMPTGMGKVNPAAMETARERSLLGRLSDPEEVAGFVACLCGTDNITGQVFKIESRRT